MNRTHCPDCHAKLERHDGVIEIPLKRFANPNGVPPGRVQYSGSFLACPACEFCEEL